jgi:arsenate reductase
VLFAAAFMLWPFARTRAQANLLLLVAVIHVATRAAASPLKGVFLRLRPEAALAQAAVNDGRWPQTFFAGGDSFPSGHVAFFWGLFLPLAWAFPRWRVPLLAVPVFVAFQRVAVNVHFVSDVLASIALAAGAAWACVLLFRAIPLLRPWTQTPLLLFHDPPLKVLVLCTANSARSIMAEALLNHLGRGHICAFSAGSHPSGQVNPLAIRVLRERGVAAGTPRSKSWDEFIPATAPQMDLVITVCDDAAGETCPRWPGTPMKAHWGLPDPADAGTPEEQLQMFRRVCAMLDHRARGLLYRMRRTASRKRLELELPRIHAAVS